jgi:hypothetical protein
LKEKELTGLCLPFKILALLDLRFVIYFVQEFCNSVLKIDFVRNNILFKRIIMTVSILKNFITFYVGF